MSSFGLAFSAASFPNGWTGNYNQFAQKLVSLLAATLKGQLLVGQYSQSTVTLPTSDIGPIFMGGQWYYWNPASLTPGYQLYIPSITSQNIRSINLLDNADFQLWQRNGGSNTPANVGTLGGAAYLADRWQVYQDGALAQTPTQGLALANLTGGLFLGNPNTLNCLRITANATAIATLGAANYCVATCRMELQRVRDLFDISPSVSVFLRSSIVGTFCLFLQDAGADRSIIFPCQITNTGLWQQFTFPSFAALPYTAGNWGTNPTDFSVVLGICAGAGSNFQANPSTDQTWQSGNSFCDSNQTNLFATASATLDICLAQLEPASVCTPYQFRRFEDSLFAAQRFYAKSYDYLVAPGTSGLQPAGVSFLATSTSLALGAAKFPRQMRVIPGTLNTYGPSSGTQNRASQNGSNTEVTTTGNENSDTSGLYGLTSSAAFVSGDLYFAEFVASADL